MAKFPAGFVPDDPGSFPEGFVPDEAPDDPSLDAIGPESFLDPKTFKPSTMHKRYRNTGSQEQVARDLNPRNIYNPDFAEYLANPITSAVDRTTAGGLGALLRGAVDINQATGTTEPTLASRSLEGMEDYRRANPVASQYTDIPGYLNPAGAPSRIAHGFSSLARKALPGFAGTLGAAAATGETLSGLDAMSQGDDDPMSILERAGSGGGAALALVPGMAGAGKLIGATGRAIQGSKGGKARQFLEQHGEDVGPRMQGMGAS